MGAEWVSAGAAVVSVAGAGFAWWREHLSKRAKTDAIRARNAALAAEGRAEQQLRTAEESVNELRRLADAMASTPSPPWQLVPKGMGAGFRRLGPRVSGVRVHVPSGWEATGRVDFLTVDNGATVSVGVWPLDGPGRMDGKRWTITWTDPDSGEQSKWADDWWPRETP